jgi:hypothetical protein
MIGFLTAVRGDVSRGGGVDSLPSISQEAFIDERIPVRIKNASWKISSLAVNGQSFLVIDGYLLNPKKSKNDLTVNSQFLRS